MTDDGGATDTVAQTVTVTEPTTGNQPPVLDPIGSQSVEEGKTLDVPVSASDADGDALTLSVDGLPSFASFVDDGDGTGTLSLSPQSGDAGSYDVTMTADDGTATDAETLTVTVTQPGGPSTASAVVRMNAGSTNIDDATSKRGVIEITNTGEANIETVTISHSSAILPDMVLDPEGTAGDKAGEGFDVARPGGTGTITTEFRDPHNGDADDGYDTQYLAFTDFDPDETVAYSVDLDPNSIKGAQAPGPSSSGAVSGLELSGSTVTVTFENGETHTGFLFGDGSQGGSQAFVGDDVPAAPALDVPGVALAPTTLSEAHSAATVGDAGQTVEISGSPGAEVRLLRVEGALFTDGVPNGGYDIEAYEANSAVVVDEQRATIGPDGTAAIDVTLTDTAQTGGRNYFVAVVERNGETGRTSNVVVLEYDAGE